MKLAGLARSESEFQAMTDGAPPPRPTNGDGGCGWVGSAKTGGVLHVTCSAPPVFTAAVAVRQLLLANG